MEPTSSRRGNLRSSPETGSGQQPGPRRASSRSMLEGGAGGVRASQRTLLSGNAAAVPKPGSARSLLVRSPSSVSSRGAAMLGRSPSGREISGGQGPPPASDADYTLQQMAASYQQGQ